MSPELTVAIPVLGHGRLLALALESLTRQAMARRRFEVIVVDDGTEPPLEPVVVPFAGRLPLTYLRHSPNRGRSAARNRALAAARGDIVLFLDADHCAPPDLLDRHREFHAARHGRPGVLLGRSINVDWAGIEALRRGEEPPPAEYREDVRDYLLAASHHRRDAARAPWVYGHTNNASVDRASLVAVGGFDEELRTWGGEDNELFYRLFHHHGRDPGVFVLSEDTVTYGLPHLRAWPLLMAQLADNHRYLAGKHPRYDIEFFGYPGTSAATARRIAFFEDALAACREHGLGQAAKTPLGLDGRTVLLIGLGASAVELAAGSVTFDYDAPLGQANLHLAGVRTPFPDSRFERVVSVDVWRFFLPEDLGAFLTEALRVAGGIDLVRTDAPVPPEQLLPLPFVGDLEYLRSTVEPYFVARVSQWPGHTVLSVDPS